MLRVALALTLPLAFAWPVAAQEEVSGSPVLRTFSVGAGPHGMRVRDGRLHVAVSGDDAVEVVDLDTGKVVDRWPVPGAPLDLVPLGEGWAVTQFRGNELIALDAGGKPTGERWNVGDGPSLFAPRRVGPLAYLVSEFADRLTVFDTEARAIVARYRTGKRPYPADVTRDGVLAFVPARDADSVTVIDLLNRRTLAEVPVCEQPEGGALTADEVSYLVACGGGDKVMAINTASFAVTGTMAAGLGPRPFSVVTTRDGRLAFANNAGGVLVSVFDPENLTPLAQIPVGEQPIVMREHDSRLYVASEVANTVSEIGLPVFPNPADVGRPNEVIVIGTVHGTHRTGQSYSLAVLERLIRAVGPDVVMAEIPPNRLGAAQAEFAATGRIGEPRVAVFPEYTEVLFPLTRALDFEIVPVAAWSAPMNEYRNAALERLAADPEHAGAWAEYQAERRAFAAALEGRGDDPAFIHSDAYDAITRAGFDAYDRHFNEELGPGGWSTINDAHLDLIERALDAHKGEGKRFLITFGASHKYRFLERLRERDDIRLLDPAPFIEQATR